MTGQWSVTDGEVDSITVLHVDDEPDFADLAATFLARRDEQIEVRTATSADDGMEILAEDDVDCVVSDYDMPGRNGIEFLEAVRETYPDLPFILFTGKGSEEIASEAISSGVSDYLQKETGTDQYAILANRIRNYVERTRAQREHSAIRERMELTLEKTHAVIFEIDVESNAVTRHGYFEQFFDIPSEDVPTWEDYIEHAVHPDDREAVRQFYRQLTDGERDSGTIEYRTNPASGDGRWLRDNVHLTETDPPHVLGIAQDITEQKSQERKRERIIDRVTDAIVEVDSDWTFTLVNDQAEDLYEMDEAYLLGRDFWDVFADAQGTRFEEEYQQVMRTREPSSFVEYFAQLDGWFDVETYPKADGGLAFYFIEVTERRRREHDLERTNSLLSTLFDALPQGIIIEDESREVLQVNRQIVDLFDVSESPDAIVGADCERLAETLGDAFVDPEGFVDRIEELIANREPTHGEELALRDGRTFERSHLPVELPDGDGHLWVYRDVTEQKRRERQLREEQQFVKSLFDALPDPLYAFDAEGYLIRWNEQLETVTGYTGDELEGMYVTEFVPEDEADEITAGVQRIIEDREPVTLESAYETKRGDRVPFEFSSAPLEGGDGTLHGLTGVGRDVTERKEHEERLVALNERNQDLIAADTRERIADIGVRAVRDILGLDANAIHLCDDESSRLVPAATTDAIHDLIGEPPVFTDGDSIAWRAYENGEPLALDDVRDDPDVYDPETPMRNELLLPLGDHGILLVGSPTPDTFDRQDRVLGEIWAANIATALAQVEQTERLRVRERELTRQNERLEEFAGIVSHDLRNPLSVAKGRLDLAREEDPSEHHDAIATALDRMERIIEDVLLLAREGQDVGETGPVDLAAAIEDAWMMVTDEIDGVDLRVGDERDPGTIDADADRLGRLLENLFRNAVEHGGENVTVTVGRLDDGFYVADDGPGVPADERERVFEAGYSTSEEGTGFGLRIVRQVVEAHGWDVEVTGSSTGGARFEITGVETIDE